MNDTRPEYDIVFENEDGTVLQSTKVREGEKIEYKGETPKKASDDQYSYEFAGWSPALAEDATATAAATYTATYTQTERKYDVVFMDDDKQTKLGEVRVSLNGDAEAAFEEAYDLPTKAETDQYIYTFDKWVDADGAEVDLTKVAADMTVYASYKAEEKEGETPDPLAGIDNLIEEPITKNYNEEAVLFESEEGLLTGSEDYKQITIVFEVKGLNGGQLWLNGLYLEGNGNNCNNQGAPRQDANFQKSRLITKDGLYSIVVGVGYTDWQKNYFEKLTKVGLNVKGTYSASYAIGKDADALSAAWIAANPGKAYQQWIESLKSETERGTVTEYIKDGKAVEPETAPTITYQALYLGSYNQTIEYYSEKSNLLDTQNVTIKGGQSTALLNPVATVDSLYTGETPVKNSTMANTAYEFDGWQDAEGNIVSQVWDNIQLYPHFKFIDNRPIYTITLKNYDDTEFAKVEVRENDVIKYTGKNPKKPSTETNSYDFTGWNTALNGTGEALTEETVATGDAVYYAQYVETERRYDVTFMAEDKETELYEVRVDKNAAATIPEELIPEKEATAEYTYTFEKWVDAEGKEVDLSKVATDLVVYASYKATENKYTVTFMDDDKETKLDEVKVSFGGKAEVAEPTKEETNGYTYKFVQWVDAEGKPADLSKVEADMTVYAEWETTLVKFSDVEKGKWYYTAVDYAYSNGILAGMSQTEFGINNETTRAMLVAVLYRQEGSPSVEGIKNPFTDVPEKEYYYNAVLWAYDNEVVFGLTDTTFGPNEKITREQLAAILYRYAKDVKKYDVSYDTRLSLSVFEDKNDISSYAQEPIKFGMDKGYISGSKDNGILKMNPKKGTTRAEMASMVMRFLEAEHTPAK